MQGCQTEFGDERWGGWERDAFHVLGFDVMFDHELNASLLEVLTPPYGVCVGSV